ncbi:ATP-grasp domain-containing protein [Enterococcus dispar]|uniref:ATP-grasp domain-containing protein n=1 Tax=Enterococcus dispar ATCC 51266 TaxID=1139219 RepID=S0KKE9_9ENTE|nr:ATP-grasp domain-containing protein [Enterococcus dispar]EOT41450.1 hypothetical protein OMK_01626 [Enterococcus dispar ATCC 51266]EOW86916.1 hypothetical protein I569_02280 [Enterococcus dispar ATCC 51266]OJG39863.1 hypothetical protein RV01_GL001045 [Enterococcus dispar]
MNGLILSCGTRNKIIQYFKKSIHELGGKIYGADASKLAPALYECDDFFIVPEFMNDQYIPTILEICKKKKINFLLSLIDTELTIIAKYKNHFENIGVTVIGPNYETAQICLNKQKMYDFLLTNEIPTQKSFFSLDDFKNARDEGDIDFPVFIKPIYGSASLGIQKVESIQELSIIFQLSKQALMIQENMNGKEFGVDCYIDIQTGSLINLFIKEKVKMRAGETDKSVSVKNYEILQLVKTFVERSQGFYGPIDIDIFEKNGIYYLSEVNPRFGGGYPHAYECGINFPHLILENVQNALPQKEFFSYQSGIYMMKYSETIIKKVDMGK